MFRTVTIGMMTAALMAMATAAHAGNEKCPKVDITFSCGDGSGGGPSPFRCNAGETETNCCARWKKNASRKWCTKEEKGLASFTCKCPPKKKKPFPVRPEDLRPRPPPMRPLGPALPKHERLPPPPPRTLKRGDSADRDIKPASCRRVAYKFTCADGSSASGNFTCRSDEGQGRCCGRARKIARQKCRHKGDIGRFACRCAPMDDRHGLLHPRRR